MELLRAEGNESGLIQSIIINTLKEDLGKDGDVTSRAIFSPSDTASAVIRSKGDGLLAGSYLLQPLFEYLDPNLEVKCLLQDGSNLKHGTEICRLNGSVTAILAGERTALNLLQRLSGIATQTAHLVSLISHTKARLLDTRKTTPLLRILEKKAVAAGGGFNHRFGLYDMILIKDTHVRAAGGVGNAIRKAKLFCKNKPELRIEVEVQTIAEFNEALELAPDRIMLDNMSCELMRQCVLKRDQTNPMIELEASGNVKAKTIAGIAQTGVDFISVGAVTHSVMALDIHLVIS